LGEGDGALKKLTTKQQAIVDFMNNNDVSFVHYYAPYGEMSTKGCGYGWPMRWSEGAPKPDARVINWLIEKHVLEYIGDGDYGLTKEYRK
jgi:hypothetical protein